jgi:FMN phosphatase YigB (HAD superfamily)
MVLLLDVANTIIHKPLVYQKAKEQLLTEGYDVPLEKLMFHHKLISEVINFPDRTSLDFYTLFNREWLTSIGILPSDDLLQRIYQSCSYLPWEKFEDTTELNQLNIPKALLSNFHGGLHQLMANLFQGQFSMVSVSEDVKIRKPDINFFLHAIDRLNISPQEIIYIGDSIKLDIVPALQVGMNAWLIDRNNYYPFFKRRIESLRDINKIM